MAEERIQRRLAAILAADVVGYSRLMEDDEAGTLLRLKAHREEFIEPEVAEHHGRIVKLMGDGILMEFASAVDAVACAVAIQKGMTQRTMAKPVGQRFVFRIGVNLGDVIIEGEDIYGNGINVAARLEALAEPGGICISERVLEQVEKNVDAGFACLGPQTVKNIEKPINAYKVLLDPGDAGKVLPERDRLANSGNRRRWYIACAAFVVLIAAFGAGIWKLALVRTPAAYSPLGDSAIVVPDRPSIAILAFDNLSGDPDQTYLSDGLAEDLITAVSYLRNLLVIARHSAFSYKGKSVDVSQIGRELGVRHVLEGSVRKVGGQLRITAQLVDTTTRDHVWAKRFDVPADHLFDVQDKIVKEIVTALNVELVEGEQARGWNRSGTNPDAYDLFLRAREAAAVWSEEALHRSIAFAGRAIEIDPGFAMGWVQRGWGRAMLAIGGWSKDQPTSWAQGTADARHALTLDPTLADAHTLLGMLYMQQGKHSEGINSLERGVELDPNNVGSISSLSLWLNTVNRSPEALVLIKKAWRLNPFPPDDYFEHLGWASLGVGQHGPAALAFDECARRLPDYVWCLLGSIASHMAAGQTDKAQVQVKALIKVAPDFSLNKFADTFSASDLKLLQKAGVPE